MNYIYMFLRKNGTRKEIDIEKLILYIYIYITGKVVKSNDENDNIKCKIFKLKNGL